MKKFVTLFVSLILTQSLAQPIDWSSTIRTNQQVVLESSNILKIDAHTLKSEKIQVIQQAKTGKQTTQYTTNHIVRSFPLMFMFTRDRLKTLIKQQSTISTNLFPSASN